MTKLNDRALSIQVDRNLLGQKLEKLGREDEAIQLYEQNLFENNEGSHPYDRLAIIYRRRKLYEDEIRVLAHAIWVYENVASKSRIDRIRKLDRFKARLLKAVALAMGDLAKEGKDYEPEEEENDATNHNHSLSDP